MFRRISFLLLLILISSVYFYTATTRAILDDGDALYAHVAQQMLERQDWVTPYANDVRFLDKPPLMYWLMAISYQVFGMTEFAARFPFALAVVGTGCLLYFLGTRTGSHSSGFIAAIAAAFCVGTFLFTRMVFPDILFVFLLTLALCSFWRWYSDQENPLTPAMLFYTSLAAAVLAKGLIGVVFPVATILLFLIWAGEWRRLKKFHPIEGGLLFLVLVLPWHVLAAQRNPGFLWYYFINEQLLRFLGRREPVDYQSISLPIFWVLILLWLFPWSAFFPAIRHLFDFSKPGACQSRAMAALALSWSVVILLFFSFSARLEHYSLSLVPPLALLVGMALSPENLFELSADARRERSIARGFTFLGILGSILAMVLLAGALVWVYGWWSSQTIRGAALHHVHAYRYYFAPLFELPPQTRSRLWLPLVGTALALSLGLMGAWWVNRRGLRICAVLVLVATMIIFCLLAFLSLGVCEETLSSRQFGRMLSLLHRPGDHVITVGDFETANSVNFYSRTPLDVYNGTAAVLEWGLGYPDAPMRILSRAELESRWRGPQRTFLLVPDNQISELSLKPQYVVLQSAGRTLLCNQPVKTGPSKGA